MVGYDVTSRVAALLAIPIASYWGGEPARTDTNVVAKPQSQFQAKSQQNLVQPPNHSLQTARDQPENSSNPQQRVYELDFDYLKDEILDLKAKSDEEFKSLANQTSNIDDLLRKKAPLQEALHTAQLQLRHIQNNGLPKVSRSVSSYAENRHQSLLPIFQAKSDATTELRFKVETLRQHKHDLVHRQDAILTDIRLLQQQTPTKKQIILKHRMDLVSIKDDQIRKLRNELVKARSGVTDRDLSGRSEYTRLNIEHEATVRNATNLKKTLKSLQNEKTNEESKWQNMFGESRRKLTQFNTQRSVKNQEAIELAIDLKSQLEAVIANRHLVQDKVAGFQQKFDAQTERIKSLTTIEKELNERGHEILCDQQVVEPVIKRVAAKLKLRKSKLSVKYAQAETRFSELTSAEEAQLKDLHTQLDVQSEAVKKLEKLDSATEDQIAKVRKEVEYLNQDTVRANNKIAEIKRHFASLRQKVHELNKWKRKLEAVGVTPQCYLLRLQERIEFANSKLLSVHKYQILCQEPTGFTPRLQRRQGGTQCKSDLPGYLKDAIHPASDPAFLETLKEAFIASDASAPYSLRRQPEDDCNAVCKKYLRASCRMTSSSRRTPRSRDCY
ncbi:hypothetical protein BV898_11814 [Hypsibius exemplaris]|uniref:Uncharacterized protein n=1 Tax=Hypsibius exemplaris TaxID=2072580 RepID=A0A1W0WFH9_HYPEX|nr:hypothetical protein BV898_11814 [Hypsibius exemplaris]